MAAFFPDEIQTIFADSRVPRSDLRVDGVVLLLFVVDYMQSHIFPRVSSMCQPFAALVDIDR
jgi:hypothetical protein